MNPILEIFNKPGEMHHAYLLEGNLEDNLATFKDAAQKLVRKSIASFPDYFEIVQSNFTVDDSELFISKQSTRSFGGGARYFVLAGQSFTPEAQNKLLKVLEEPLPGNHIFIFVPKSNVLLPTLLSRLSVIEGDNLPDNDTGVFCETFIGSTVTSRMVMIEKFLKINGGDGESTNLKHKTKDIFSQFEKTFSDIILNSSGEKTGEVSKFLSELLEVKKYLDDSAPSVRLILEYVAFICPQIKL